MRIASAELRELVLPLVEPFIISGGVIHERRSLIVVLRDGEGHVGYGESPPFDLPFYSEETLASARDLLGRVLLPRVVGRDFASPEDLDAAIRVGVRGNPFARAGVETAAWDLEAHRRGVGLAFLLGERLGVAPAATIACGVALGIPEDRDVDTVCRWVQEAIAQGYQRVKLKIAPGWDREPIRAVRDVLADSHIPLTVDANGAYEWPAHESALRAIDGDGLLYLEQPLPPEELLGHVQLSRSFATPICVDETLRSAAVARQLAELGGPSVWNVKVHRIGGLAEVCRLWRVAGEFQARLWAGTMPESGIGSQAALAAAALPYFVYPSDVEPSARWFGRNVDVVKLVMGPEGRMAVPNVSIERLLDRDRFRRATRLVDAFGDGDS